MKRVLVTGGSGFIGTRCLRALQGAGAELHATHLSSLPAGEAEVTWHRANLLNEEDRARLIETIRPTHLLHLAWDVEPGSYWTSDANYAWLAGSLDLAERFQRHGGKRAVFAGTCAEYDWSHGRCSETATPLEPATIYGQCKRSLYDSVSALAEATGLSWAWGRIFFVYGPGEAPSRLIPYVIRALLSDTEALCSSGEQERDFTHVDDLAAAFSTLLASDGWLFKLLFQPCPLFLA